MKFKHSYNWQCSDQMKDETEWINERTPMYTAILKQFSTPLTKTPRYSSGTCIQLVTTGTQALMSGLALPK